MKIFYVESLPSQVKLTYIVYYFYKVTFMLEKLFLTDVYVSRCTFSVV